MQPRASVINEICSLYDCLSDREQSIADYVMAHQLEVLSMTTREIASATESSAATVSRFARHLGYRSYPELCAALARENKSDGEGISSASVSLADPRAAMKTVLIAKRHELVDTVELIDEAELVRAVHLIEQASSIEFGAVGNSIPAALSASFLMAQLGLHSSCAPTTEAMVLSSLSLTSHDVIVFISKSGHSKRLNKMMENSLEAGTPTIVITNISDSPLARRATCVLQAATRDKMLSSSLPFSHNSINFIIEVIFLLLCSDVENLPDQAGLLWKSLGEDKGVESEVF